MDAMGRLRHNLALLDGQTDRRAEGGDNVGKLKLIIWLLFLTALAVCACSDMDRWPRVRIEYTGRRIDSIVIPLRDGHRLAEDVYEIAETEVGYDIIIHAERVR
jgi:hypothetical protein